MAIAPSKASKSESPKTLTDQAYQQLRDDIVHGHLAPNTKLRIESLRQQYGVGATPLREALSRLSADGFVTIEGQRGFKVADMTKDDLEDVTNLRVVLESQALTQSIVKGDDTWEAGVVAAFHRLSKLEESEGDRDINDWEKRNADFHNALIGACRSKWLRRFYDTLYDQHKRYRNLARSDTHARRDIHAEHEAIYKAALNRDAEAACKANEFHIRETAEVVKRLMLDEWETRESA
ncbi:GntR family transcriptional regulator [Thiosocius teredinicola]|uniref:GntR family transcriptional regulator n=1 Tax=Thiosocius teredinicola TaxID=1973002 RepID=UPI000990D34E